MTVLANEQVIDGRGWRSGALVEQRELTQWFFKISDYSEDLLNALDRLDRWPEKVRLMQKNWIGRSRGPAGPLRARSEDDARAARASWRFSRRGRTPCSARSSWRSRRTIRWRRPRRRTIRSSRRSSTSASTCGTAQAEIDTAEKLGFDTGIRAVHPFDPSWTLPVYVANFILMEYGTGAIFGCPAHDQRDLDFVNKYDLGNVPVVCPPGQDPKSFVITDTAYDGDGTMINSRFLDGMTIEQAKDEVAKRLETQTRGNAPVAQRQVNFRLRDWGISRQRYWGCPIPIIHCEKCGVVPVPVKDLPVQLPEDVTFDKPGNPLDRHPTWKNVACPQCGEPARRETDTMDTFVDSSWYFARFTDPWNDDAPTDRKVGRRMAAGRSVHRRHRARDPASALFALLHPRDEGDRPRRHRRAVRRPVHPGHGGARDLRRRQNGEWVTPAEVKIEGAEGGTRTATLAATGEPITIGGIEKMSKSKKNTIDPDDIMATYGADVARWFMLSDSPPERDVEWTERGVQGAWRFTNRLWRLVGEAAELAKNAPADRPATFGEPALAVRKAAHGALAKVSDAIEKLHFNVAVAHIYEFANALGSAIAKPAATPGFRLGDAGGRRHHGAAVPPDDAAPGRGVLGRARPRHPGRRRALAGGRSRTFWSKTPLLYRSRLTVRSGRT